MSKDTASLWRRWVDRPQRIALRRAVFQVHLWLALVLGVYVVVISLSGSAVVFRREFNLWMVPRSVSAVIGVALSGDSLRHTVEAAYPGRIVISIREPRRRDGFATVTLERDGERTDRLFDPYAAVDRGSTYPTFLRVVEWLVDLHDNLLAGEMGREVNGIGGALVIVVIGSGIVLWWPGRRRWRSSLSTGRPAMTRRFAWRLHSALGFWTLPLMFFWALTAVYFAFPDPFEATIDYFDLDVADQSRPGESLLLALIQLHFGRFGGLGVRVLWVVLGLLPAVLFVTGFVVWWTRVVRPRWRALRRRADAATVVATHTSS